MIGDGVRHLAPAVSDVDAIEAGKAVQQFVAVVFLDINTLAAGHNSVGHVAACELRQMRGGMKKRTAVPLVQLVVSLHVWFS